MPLLLLPPIPPHINPDTDLPFIASSIAIFATRKCEPAGHSYDRFQRGKLGILNSGTSEQEVDEEGKASRNREEEDDMKRRKEWEAQRAKHDIFKEEKKAEKSEEDKKKKKKKKGSKNDGDSDDEEEDVNLYEVLGIGHLGFNASQKQIKKAYQKSILLHHPDKKAGAANNKTEESADKDGEEETEESKEFLLVQKAWETLSNETKRRGYDSTFEFDEWIPTGNEDIADDDDAFYELYSDVFERNGRFSVKKPVPHLGDKNTDIEKVLKFYEFWGRFESWREFVKFDEFKDGDIETASCREEKRWMNRQNLTIRKKKKKEEYERVMALVTRAQQVDPRMIKYRNELQAEKEKKKKEKTRAKEEKARLELEEKLAREAKEKEDLANKKAQQMDDKKRRQNEKRRMKFNQKLLTKLCELSFSVLNTEPKEKLEILTHINDVVADNELSEADSQVQKLLQCFPIPDVLSLNFSKVESVEKKHAQKGIRNLLNIIRNIEDNAHESEVEEEEEQVPEPQPSADDYESKTSEPWSVAELSTLAKAVKKYPGGTRKRWESVAEYVNLNCSHAENKERSADDCVNKVKEIGKLGGNKVHIGKDEAFSQFQNTLKSNNRKNSVEEIPIGNWTSDEQSKFEVALKTFPSTLEKNERWSAIAAAVGSKSKKECVERFKELRAQALAKREGK